MKTLNKYINQKLTLILLGFLGISFNPATVNAEMKSMGQILKAREMASQKEDHSKHKETIDENQTYHGVYYGFLPCKGCPGIKTTLSLKNKKNYLLVTQQVQTSSREFYEKGKYTWDDDAQIVTLIARKDSSIRKFRIKNDETLIELNAKGLPVQGDQKRHTLTKRDLKPLSGGHNH